jgi:transcription initiation factor TFIIH subunit 1
LFCSKEGAAQVRLKLGLVGDDTGHNFTFTSPQPIAYTERENFKRELTNIISRNRSTIDLPSRPSLSIATSIPPSNAPTPRPLLSRASTSRAASVSSDGRTPIIAGSDPASDFRLRKKVLMSNTELASLHRDLVISGQITETEFWEGREVCFHFCATHISLKFSVGSTCF